MPELQVPPTTAELNLSLQTFVLRGNETAGCKACFVLNQSAVYRAASRIVTEHDEKDSRIDSHFILCPSPLHTASCFLSGPWVPEAAIHTSCNCSHNHKSGLVKNPGCGTSAIQLSSFFSQRYVPLIWPLHHGFLALLSELACA